MGVVTEVYAVLSHGRFVSMIRPYVQVMLLDPGLNTKDLNLNLHLCEKLICYILSRSFPPFMESISLSHSQGHITILPYSDTDESLQIILLL
jgi:hypothetical protein